MGATTLLQRDAKRYARVLGDAIDAADQERVGGVTITAAQAEMIARILAEAGPEFLDR